MEWKIGNVTIKNQVVLAPMAGYTNKAFRQIAEEMGAGLTVTEMISSEALVRENKKTLSMIDIADEKSVVAVQIFGSDPKTMASAAKILCETYKDIKIIDINMGCPVPKVAIASHSGSALLKDPEKVFAIVKEVTSAVPVPVTVKIRLGWDDSCPYEEKVEYRFFHCRPGGLHCAGRRLSFHLREGGGAGPGRGGPLRAGGREDGGRAERTGRDNGGGCGQGRRCHRGRLLSDGGQRVCGGIPERQEDSLRLHKH